MTNFLKNNGYILPATFKKLFQADGSRQSMENELREKPKFQTKKKGGTTKENQSHTGR